MITAAPAALPFVFAGLHDPAATDYDVPVIKYRGLAGGNRALWLVEGHQNFVGA